jgi:hypothetical protein
MIGNWDTEPVFLKLREGAKPYHGMTFPTPKSPYQNFEKRIQECEETFSRELGISKFTIAYSHPSNIQSIIEKSKLFEVEGKEVSKHFTWESD